MHKHSFLVNRHLYNISGKNNCRKNKIHSKQRLKIAWMMEKYERVPLCLQRVWPVIIYTSQGQNICNYKSSFLSQLKFSLVLYFWLAIPININFIAAILKNTPACFFCVYFLFYFFLQVSIPFKNTKHPEQG